MLAIRLSEEIEDRLAALAKATGRTKTFYAREAILRYIDEMEDVYLAEKRLEDIKANRSTTIPLEDVMKRYGSDTPELLEKTAILTRNSKSSIATPRSILELKGKGKHIWKKVNIKQYIDEERSSWNG